MSVSQQINCRKQVRGWTVYLKHAGKPG